MPLIIGVVKGLGLEILVENADGFVRENLVLPVIHRPSGIRVDLIFSFTPYERGALERAKRVRVNDEEVCFASAEDLVIHKMVAGRPRDIEDVRGILLKNPGIEKDYILHWLREFDRGSGLDLAGQFEELAASHLK